MTNPVELTKAIDRWRHAERPNLREAFHSSALSMALHLADERDALIEKMEIRWRWLDEHLGHAQFVEREDALLVDLKRYEAMEDVLGVAAETLLGDAA